MNSTACIATVLCVGSLCLIGCASGWNHTSDVALEKRFQRHEAEFEALLARVQADSQLTTIYPPTLVYGGVYTRVDESKWPNLQQLGFSRELWDWYEEHTTRLGIIAVLKAEGRIEFRVDAGTVSNGDSYKGYEYSPVAPKHLLASLDGFRISDRTKDVTGGWLVHKPLKSNWYIYLFVNS